MFLCFYTILEITYFKKIKHKCSISKIFNYIIKCHLYTQKKMLIIQRTGNSYTIQSTEGRQTVRRISFGKVMPEKEAFAK